MYDFTHTVFSYAGWPIDTVTLEDTGPRAVILDSRPTMYVQQALVLPGLFNE